MQGQWLGQWGGSWLGDVDGAGGNPVVAAALHVASAGTLQATALCVIRTALSVEGFGDAVLGAQLDGETPSTGAGQVSNHPLGRPVMWTPYNPKHPRRPKKRRHSDVLFL